MKKVLKIGIIVCIIALIFITIWLYINKKWIFDEFRNVNIEPNIVVNKLQERLDFGSSYLMDENEVKEKYYIEDESILSSFSVLSSYINLQASEIGIFRLANKKDIEVFREKLVKRAEDIIKYFEGYIYSEEQISREYEIRVYNDTIILVIYNNKENIIKCIEKIILE